MRFLAKPAIALLLVTIAFAAVDGDAQTTTASSATRGAATAAPMDGVTQLTGKERLGDKWTDEQRTDNCKVPLDKRGTKYRPDGCVHTPMD